MYHRPTMPRYVKPLYKDVPKGFFGQLSYPEIIRKVLADAGGQVRMLTIRNAILQADVCRDPDLARINIYEALRRMPDVIKVEPGLYRLEKK